MAIKVADAFVPITGDDSPLRRTLDGTRKHLNNWTNNVVQGIGQGIGQALFNNIQRGLSAGIGLITASVRASSDLAETLSKVNTVFGTSSKTIIAWSKTTSTSFGISQQAALEATSSIGNMFLQMGENSDRAATLSIGMVELAADIASFHNAAEGTVGVLADMQSAFRGEFDPIQKYIPLINAASVQQLAMEQSGKGAAKALTSLDKALATQTLLLQGAGVAAGDFARTINGIANQERILDSKRQDALATIGQAFAPIYLTILQGLNDVIDQVTPYGEGIVQSLATGMVRGIIFLLPVIRQIRDFFIEWMRPSSPPKFLPDLAKWGAEAMQVYLNGWSQADFGVLQNLGGAIEGILRSFVTSGKIAENDIVNRVFGSRQAIASAVNEWRRAGSITEGSINAIEAAAGPAGFALAGLVRSYFDMEGASRRAAAAQQELTDVTERYERLLDPLQGALDEINAKQQAIRDRQQISSSRRTLRDPAATANEKRLAQLEIEEIGIRQQMTAVEKERDVAVDAATEKLKAARKQEEVARAIYGAQQALLDQQIITNRLIGEENDLRRKQAEEAQRLYDATLRYNLALADTEGKIALMRLELERHEKGSVGYFDILTQIAGLEQQLAREREAGAPPPITAESILGDPADLAPKWVKDLQKELEKAYKDIFGIVDPILGPMPDPHAFGATTIKGGSPFANVAPSIEVSQQMKDFVQSIKDLVDALQEVEEPLSTLADTFGELSAEEEKAGDKIEKDVPSWLERMTNEVRFWTAIMNHDWATAWDTLLIHIQENQRQAEEEQVGFQNSILGKFLLWKVIDFEAWNQWLSDKSTAFTGFLQGVQDNISEWDLGEAGRAFINSLWLGMKDFWDTTVKPWWDKTALGKMVDMLPGSEPKDPTSPLAGLQERGKAIVSNLQLGIDEASLNIGQPNFGALAAGATTNTSTSRSFVFQPGSVVFNGVEGGADAADKFEERMREFLANLS